MNTSQEHGIESIKRNREDLEYLAENAQHTDWIAEALLEVAEE